MKLSSYLSSAGWFVLLALLMLSMFASSCASSGYCKSWNNPCSSVPAGTVDDKG